MLINLTPHPVTVFDGDTPILTIPPSGTVARLTETATEAPPIGGVAVTSVRLGKTTGLPEQQDGVTYIVSMPLLMGVMTSATWQRRDLVYPYGQVRDADGRIIGCRGLARIRS